MSDSRLLALILVFSPVSLLSFGGGQATIPQIQHQVVAVHGWLSNEQFADLYAISRAAPGPSTLIVALIGWQVCGILGAVVATLAVFVPSSMVMLAGSVWWQRYENAVVRNAIEQGLAPVAVGLIFAGALIVLKSANAGAMGLVTTGVVCVVQSTTRVSMYVIMAAVAAVYGVFFVCLNLGA